MRRTIPTLTTIVLASCLPALAQAPRPGVDAAQKKSVVTADRTAHRDDLRDVATLTALAKRHDAARAAKDKRALRLVRVDIRSAAMKELQEAQIEAATSTGTVVTTAAAVSTGPVVRNAAAGPATGGRKTVKTASVSGPVPDEEAAPRSEKADRVDDARDPATHDRIQTRRLEIANDLRNMPVATSDAQNTHERGLLTELIALAKADIPSDAHETRGGK
ncbi:MAG: hypothetical protein HY049_10155 [Acidobacteria bacterium]|nr:hypothetical protein [Acidobacteriota bacterium]